MATTVSLSNAAKSAQADALARRIDNGSVKIYSGAVPATVDTALSGNTLLASLPLSATSAPAASNGLLTFNTITDDSSADATGTAAFYRVFQSDGTTAEFQGTVGTSGESLNLDTVSITIGDTVSITSFTYQV